MGLAYSYTESDSPPPPDEVVHVIVVADAPPGRSDCVVIARVTYAEAHTGLASTFAAHPEPRRAYILLGPLHERDILGLPGRRAALERIALDGDQVDLPDDVLGVFFRRDG